MGAATMNYENLFEELHRYSTDDLEALRKSLGETIENPRELLDFMRYQCEHIDLILRYRRRYGKRKDKRPAKF